MDCRAALSALFLLGSEIHRVDDLLVTTVFAIHDDWMLKLAGSLEIRAFSSEVDTVCVKKMRQNKSLEHDPIQLDRIML